jgi:hypothetical protein
LAPQTLRDAIVDDWWASATKMRKIDGRFRAFPDRAVPRIGPQTIAVIGMLSTITARYQKYCVHEMARIELLSCPRVHFINSVQNTLFVLSSYAPINRASFARR